MTSQQSRERIAPKDLSIPIDEVATAASAVLTSDNTNPSNGEKVTIGTVEYTFKTTLTGAANEVEIGADADATLTNLKNLINSGRAAVAASGVLTSDETNPAAADEVVVGDLTYAFVTALTEAYATATLTSDNTNPAAGDLVVVGDITYQFVSSLTVDRGHGQSDPLEIPNRILIGANADTTLGNLVAAINGAAGEGTKYSYGTVVNPKVSAAAVGSHASVMTAKALGVVGNAIAKSETSSHLDWDGTGAVFTGGLDSVANEVLIDATPSADQTLQNLADAINDGGNGTTVSTATVANPDFTSGDVTSHAITVTAKVAGTAGNAFAKTETSDHLDWDGSGAVMTGGVAATAAHALVSCGNVTAHAVTVTAKTAGYDGNSIAKSEDSAHLDWDGTGEYLTGGGATTGTSDEIGDAGGFLSQLIVKAPQLDGTITYTVSIIDADGVELYTSDSQVENDTTLTDMQMSVSSTDKIKIVCSGLVENNDPFTVFLR